MIVKIVIGWEWCCCSPVHDIDIDDETEQSDSLVRSWHVVVVSGGADILTFVTRLKKIFQEGDTFPSSGNGGADPHLTVMDEKAKQKHIWTR